ncbi:hypothetical protein A7Q01_01680 [Eikenella sp. NML96-A-049]|nr:hypothetical protein A7P97_07280 [Eikenella sp. NML070372]OAM41673.1 hypothetical protein A7Q01_01680 [Eikenella sp. NML96-A-049]
MAVVGSAVVVLFSFGKVWLDAVAVLAGATEDEPVVGAAFFGEFAVGAAGGDGFGQVGGERGAMEVFEQGGAVEGFGVYDFPLEVFSGSLKHRLPETFGGHSF